MDLYRLDQLTALRAASVGSDQLQILYRPKSESLYFSPGVALGEHPGLVEVRFVRCRVGEKCTVTHAAQAGQNGVLTVVVSKASGGVRATDGKQVKDLLEAP